MCLGRSGTMRGLFVQHNGCKGAVRERGKDERLDGRIKYFATDNELDKVAM